MFLFDIYYHDGNSQMCPESLIFTSCYKQAPIFSPIKHLNNPLSAQMIPVDFQYKALVGGVPANVESK